MYLFTAASHIRKLRQHLTLDVVLGFFLKLEEDTCCNSEKGKEILKFRFRHCEAT